MFMLLCLNTIKAYSGLLLWHFLAHVTWAMSSDVIQCLCEATECHRQISCLVKSVPPLPIHRVHVIKNSKVKSECTFKSDFNSLHIDNDSLMAANDIQYNYQTIYCDCKATQKHRNLFFFSSHIFSITMCL